MNWNRNALSSLRNGKTKEMRKGVGVEEEAVIPPTMGSWQQQDNNTQYWQAMARRGSIPEKDKFNYHGLFASFFDLKLKWVTN